MKLKIFFLLLIIPSILLAQTSTPEQEAKDIENFKSIKSLINRGRIKEARTSLKEFIEKYPNSELLPEAQYTYAKFNNNINSAIEEFLLIVNEFPNSPYAEKSQYYISDYYFLKGKYNEATDEYRKYINQFPDGEFIEQAMINLANCLTLNGKYNDALQLLKQVQNKFKKRAKDPFIIDSIGECYLGIGDYENTNKIYKELIAKFPNYELLSKAYLNYALSLEELIQIDEAKKYYNELIKSFPKSREALLAQYRLDDLEKSKL